MKHVKLLVLVMMLGVSGVMHALTPVAAANGTLKVINKSDMIVGVAIFFKPADGGQAVARWVTPNPISAGGESILTYSKGEAIHRVDIYYRIVNAQTNDRKVDGTMNFYPTTFNENSVLYIHGHGAFKVGEPDTTIADKPTYSRYAAWWSGNIPASLSTAQAAMNDAAVKKLVTIYPANENGAGSDDASIAAGKAIAPF